MQEFLAKDVISCNLISLTGYRTLVILYELMKSPKSIDELNEVLYDNKYINEKFSTDTLRIYINSLREAGCEITRATKKNDNKFCMISNPFEIKIKNSEIKYLKKILTAKDNVDILALLKVEAFIKKLSEYVNNEKLSNSLKNLLILERINKNLIKELLDYCEKKVSVNILYNSPHTGNKEISVICDKLFIKNRKLYLAGTSITHKKTYSTFLAERIIDILSINLRTQKTNSKDIELICSISDDKFYPDINEEIIGISDKNYIVKIVGKNEFFLIQKILHMGNKCKIIEPDSFKQKFLKTIAMMEKNYEQ